MELLTTVFQTLLSMALTALPVTAVVLLVRLLLKKAPKKYSYALWLVVAFRLACPVALESPVGLVQTDRAEVLTQEWADHTYVAPTRTFFESAEG